MDFRPIDADNHYYEPLDAFTRHLDPQVQATAACRPVQDGKRVQLAHRRQGQPVRPEPDVRPDHRAGLPRPAVPRPDPRGRRPAHADAGRAARAPSTGTATPALRGARGAGPRRGAAVPDARLRRRAGPPATTSTRPWPASPRSTAGSRRTGASPYETASSPRRCSRSPIPTPRSTEVDSPHRAGRPHRARPPRAGARRATARAARSATSCHDPVWARLAEASIPVAFHLGDSGYNALRRGVGRRRHVRASAAATRSASCSSPTGAIHDTIASLIVARRVQPPPRRCGSPASRTAPTGCALLVKRLQQAGEPDAVGVRGGSARHDPRATCGSRRTTRRTCTRSPT